HEVVAAPQRSQATYSSLPGHALRMVREQVLRGVRPSSDERRLLRLARAHPPDMVLSLTWDVHPEVLDELGKMCAGRRVLWWGDAPANSQRWGLLNSGWDWIFVKDPAAVGKLRLVGRNAHLLHEAMNPAWHRPVARQANDAVVVAGN